MRARTRDRATPTAAEPEGPLAGQRTCVLDRADVGPAVSHHLCVVRAPRVGRRCDLLARRDQIQDGQLEREWGAFARAEVLLCLDETLSDLRELIER